MSSSLKSRSETLLKSALHLDSVAHRATLQCKARKTLLKTALHLDQPTRQQTKAAGEKGGGWASPGRVRRENKLIPAVTH